MALFTLLLPLGEGTEGTEWDFVVKSQGGIQCGEGKDVFVPPHSYLAGRERRRSLNYDISCELTLNYGFNSREHPLFLPSLGQFSEEIQHLGA